jgi:hypothetical protein
MRMCALGAGRFKTHNIGWVVGLLLVRLPEVATRGQYAQPWPAYILGGAS